MKRLYSVRIETDVFVVAESEDEACRIGGRAIREESASSFEIDAEPVGATLRPSIARSMPYGEDLGARRGWTCEQWWLSGRVSGDGAKGTP